MKGINIRRLLLTARHNALTNRAEVVRTFFIMTFGLLAVYEVNLWNPIWRRQPYFDGVLAFNHIMMPTAGIFILFMVFMPGSVFDNMKTKQKRTAFLMLPASAAEKFVVRWLWVTVVMAAVFLASMICADVLRWLCCLTVGPDVHGSVTLYVVSELPHFFAEVFDGNTRGYPGIACNVSRLLFIQSLFVLGGTFFHKNAMLCTAAVIMVLWIGSAYAGTPIGSCRNLAAAACGDDRTADMVMTAVMLGLTALCYALAYRLFRRMEVINNMRINT